MTMILVISEHPALAEAVCAALPGEDFRVVHRAGLEEAEPLLVHGVARAVILDVELSGVQAIWPVEKIRRWAPHAPLILCSGVRQAEWEEEALAKGAAQVISKPIRPRMLVTLLERLLKGAVAATGALPGPVPLPAETPPASSAPVATAIGTQTLGILRGFSRILTHSLDAEGMLKQFLVFLRENLGVNRAAIFLRQPAAGFGTSGGDEGLRLRAASSIGLASGLLQHLELSLESGLGGHVARLGRILRRSSPEIRGDLEAQKEFELLSAQVAIPVFDREQLLGVALFDARITGEPLLNPELELIFHLLEQLGLAVRNIRLHDQLAGNHQMLVDILRELNCACVVVNRELAVLHANKAARKHLGAANTQSGELEFSDLPEALGTKVYQALKTGSAVTNFRYTPKDSPGTVYSATVVPFQWQQSGEPACALLIVEDLTQSEQLRRLEIETANLRLVKSMAERLTNEIGNAMVPVSTHQQLLADKWKDAEFRASLDTSLADSVKRVDRLIQQMRFLARDNLIAQEAFPLGPLLEEAYQEACKHQSAKASQLRYEAPGKAVVLTGDRAALKHAFSEIMLNALQANPKEPKVAVRLRTEANGSSSPELQIEVQDNGPGFTAEAAENALVPFYSERIVGLGLGLTVSRKIIETHRGKLQILPSTSGVAGVVRVFLPLETAKGSPQ
jgi:nitrogen-specific signal transduction histidine kinase/CheY-like chemotaxis protein